MLIKLKIPLTILILVVLFVGVSLPVTGASHFKAPAKVIITDQGKTDDPWDPGDESDPLDRVKPSAIKSVDPEMTIAKRSDDPWDPGDESPHKVGVRDV